MLSLKGARRAHYLWLFLSQRKLHNFHNLIEGEDGGKLKKKLESNGFQITSSKIEKFSMFICIKK
jgi:hypothetical protein